MLNKKCENCNNLFYAKGRVGTKEHERRKSCSIECSAELTLRKRIGAKSGRLTVIGFEGKGNSLRYICECTCGNIKTFLPSTIFRTRKNRTKSCGCLARERLLPVRDARFWRIWNGMKARVKYPHLFTSYKGVGINSAWLSPTNFFNDMYESYCIAQIKYKGTASIERINVYGDYCKENCTWIPMADQSKNRKPYAEWEKA